MSSPITRRVQNALYMKSSALKQSKNPATENEAENNTTTEDVGLVAEGDTIKKGTRTTTTSQTYVPGQDQVRLTYPQAWEQNVEGIQDIYPNYDAYVADREGQRQVDPEGFEKDLVEKTGVSGGPGVVKGEDQLVENKEIKDNYEDIPSEYRRLTQLDAGKNYRGLKKAMTGEMKLKKKLGMFKGKNPATGKRWTRAEKLASTQVGQQIANEMNFEVAGNAYQDRAGSTHKKTYTNVNDNTYKNVPEATNTPNEMRNDKKSNYAPFKMGGYGSKSALKQVGVDAGDTAAFEKSKELEMKAEDKMEKAAGNERKQARIAKRFNNKMDRKVPRAERKADKKGYTTAAGDITLPPLKMDDLSGDGKVTKKDVLIGRGVIDKDGTPLKQVRKFLRKKFDNLVSGGKQFSKSTPTPKTKTTPKTTPKTKNQKFQPGDKVDLSGKEPKLISGPSKTAPKTKPKTNAKTPSKTPASTPKGSKPSTGKRVLNVGKRVAGYGGLGYLASNMMKPDIPENINITPNVTIPGGGGGGNTNTNNNNNNNKPNVKPGTTTYKRTFNNVERPAMPNPGYKVNLPSGPGDKLSTSNDPQATRIQNRDTRRSNRQNRRTQNVAQRQQRRDMRRANPTIVGGTLRKTFGGKTYDTQINNMKKGSGFKMKGYNK